MYDRIVAQCVQSLLNIETMLDKADAQATAEGFDIQTLLNSRLASNMGDLIFQVRSACDYVKGAAAWLSGQVPPVHADDEQTLADLRERIRKTVAFARTVTADQYAGAADRRIAMSWKPGQVLSGEDYVLQMTVPNVYFHIVTLYAILRHHGVPLDKADYFGPVRYVPGEPTPAIQAL